MTTHRDSFLQEIQNIRSELGRLLEGMDYCLDWKPGDEEWSAREVVYHLVDTPGGGVHTAVQSVLTGDIQELSITASLTNLTQERLGNALNQAQEDITNVLTGLERALGSATDAELTDKKVPVHSITRATTMDRNALELVERIFVRHWREHLAQLAELRDALGLD